MSGEFPVGKIISLTITRQTEEDIDMEGFAAFLDLSPPWEDQLRADIKQAIKDAIRDGPIVAPRGRTHPARVSKAQLRGEKHQKLTGRRK